ncbi:hypothetical protein NVS55_40255 (plasmid) [Myxococcus stipitatus]|uniref:hypothetical protein n=1 Tax=Myxococcus stipitatus TaxID=83455 RepID=UPI003144F709
MLRIIRSNTAAAENAKPIAPAQHRKPGRVLPRSSFFARRARPFSQPELDDTETTFALLTVELDLTPPSDWSPSVRRYWTTRAQLSA